jgi:hypothetical protein
LQLGKYWQRDDCVFSSELAFVKVNLIDGYGNHVPSEDREMFDELFEFEFELGSEFTTLDCYPYEVISSNNTVICPIRPTLSGLQSLTASAESVPFA